MRSLPWSYISRRLTGSLFQREHTITLQQFRDQYFIPELPLSLRRDPSNTPDDLSPSFPHVNRLWLDYVLGQPPMDVEPGKTRLPYVSPDNTHLPYELMVSPQDLNVLQKFDSWTRSLKHDRATSIANIVAQAVSECPLPGGDDAEGAQMVRLSAPLGLLSLACSFNYAKVSPRPLRRLYIAQAPISDLPDVLAEGLPVPELVSQAGKGDLYGTSIWMGLTPTYSPWHRDPNPNLFHQLFGTKTFRIMPPAAGERVFREVQSRIGLASNPRIRAMEMFQGAEVSALREAIWGPTSESLEELLQKRLVAGESLFLPKGWWHSVRSEEEEDGRLNVSVNFWFR